MINKNRAKVFLKIIEKIILGFGGVEKGCLIVREYLIEVKDLGNGHSEILRGNRWSGRRWMAEGAAWQVGTRCF